jgi:PAS domain S-box-containing protein
MLISRLSDGIIVDANDAFLQLIECKREEAIGVKTSDLGIFRDQNQRRQLATMLAKDNIENLETEIQSRNGKPLTVIASVHRICTEDEEYILSTVMDITERRKTEEALRISEQRYRLLFSNMSNGFAYCKMIYDESGTPIDFVYIEINDAFETLTGLKKSMVLGNKATQAIPTIKQEHPELFEKYGRVASSGKSETFELFFKPLSIWLSISAYSLTNGYFATVFENITEKKQIEKLVEQYSEGLEFTVAERTQELIEAQNRLLKTERLSAIGELAGMVGHDLRNPLTAIKNAAYIVRKNQGSLISQNNAEMLNIIDRSVTHANSIVGDLLDYSRDLHLELEEHSAKSLLNYILLSMTIPNTVKVTQSNDDSASVWIDANKIERVFTNLIKNAIEAMPNGGTLEISTRQNGGNIEFIFADTGKGMSQEVLTRIFTPLFTTKAQGMGLGLAICKRIIEAHKGKITVESSPSVGTKFFVTIPTGQPNVF